MPLASDPQQKAEQYQQRAQHWGNIISELHTSPISNSLRAYFTELKGRSPAWDMDTFIEGIQRFIRLWGSERAEYFMDKLLGLHTPNSFTKVWNELSVRQPITALDQSFRLQCPPTWSTELRDGCWCLIYQGEAPLSQGLNEFLQGPTTLDCGMCCCQLLIWMAIRFLLGDTLFDQVFRFKAGQFILTQKWYMPLNHAGSMGNLLFYFLDTPTEDSDTSLKNSRIILKTVFNHPKYISKHPGGSKRLENVIQIDDYNILFDPESPENTCSDLELDQHLRQAFNAPQTPADVEKLIFFTNCPEKVSSFSDFPYKNAETILEEASTLGTYTLGDEEWIRSQCERQWLARGLRRVLNFPRLIKCLKEAEEAYLENVSYDVLTAAKRDHSNANQARILQQLSSSR